MPESGPTWFDWATVGGLIATVTAVIVVFASR